MMNPFYEAFPNVIEVGGVFLPIKTDFRAVLKMMDVLDNSQEPEERLRAILGIFKAMPEDLEEAVRAVAHFVAGDKKTEQEGDEEKESKKTISYVKDAPCIIGDFLRFYQIDLTSCRFLHWRKFQLLLEGLSEESETKKRIAYRCMDVRKIKNKEERARILRIQKALSIEDTEADAERIGELFGGLS